ncbi:UDP-galactose transporter [Meredithblackwellia eburnea MCA 4105]
MDQEVPKQEETEWTETVEDLAATTANELVGCVAKRDPLLLLLHRESLANAGMLGLVRVHSHDTLRLSALEAALLSKSEGDGFSTLGCSNAHLNHTIHTFRRSRRLIIQLLLLTGASPDLRGATRVTARERAGKLEDKEALRLFEEWDMNNVQSEGWKHAMYAIQQPVQKDLETWLREKRYDGFHENEELSHRIYPATSEESPALQGPPPNQQFPQVAQDRTPISPSPSEQKLDICASRLFPSLGLRRAVSLSPHLVEKPCIAISSLPRTGSLWSIGAKADAPLGSALEGVLPCVDIIQRCTALSSISDADLALSSQPCWPSRLKYFRIYLFSLLFCLSISTGCTHGSVLYFTCTTALSIEEQRKSAYVAVPDMEKGESDSDSGDEGLEPPRGWREAWSRQGVAIALGDLKEEIFFSDWWSVAVLALLHTIQNKLHFVATSTFDTSKFQITNSLQISSATLFSVLILKRRISWKKCTCIILLVVGVGIVQLSSSEPATSVVGGTDNFDEGLQAPDPILSGLGLLAALGTCITGGLAGVYFEKILKENLVQVWARVIQLSMFTLIPVAWQLLLPWMSYGLSSDLDQRLPQAPMVNFGLLGWCIIWFQVTGGLVTAMVLKHTDSVLKEFASALSVIVSFLGGFLLVKYEWTWFGATGACMVVYASCMYAQQRR